jgi:hypothetical protein
VKERRQQMPRYEYLCPVKYVVVAVEAEDEKEAKLEAEGILGHYPIDFEGEPHVWGTETPGIKVVELKEEEDVE